jgi:methionyl-tRNA synthetase
LVLPDNVVSSEFLTMEGQKFSNSRGIVIEVRDFLERYDPDSLRYYLTAAGPETQDTDFTWAEFIRRNNDELVATWGNLVNRTLTIAKKNFGEVPAPGQLSPRDEEVLVAVEDGFDSVGKLLDAARFKAALAEVMALAARVNQYLAENEPWHLVGSDRERAATVLYIALRCIDNLKVQLLPFLPFSCQRLHLMLGHQGLIAPMPVKVAAESAGDPHLILTGDYLTPEASWTASRLAPGQPLGEPVALFRKLEPALAEQELARMAPVAQD